MEEFERLWQNGFQEYFQNLYSRWQNCVVAQGDCVDEGYVAEAIVLFWIFQEKKWFREHFEATTYWTSEVANMLHRNISIVRCDDKVLTSDF